MEPSIRALKPKRTKKKPLKIRRPFSSLAYKTQVIKSSSFLNSLSNQKSKIDFFKRPSKISASKKNRLITNESSSFYDINVPVGTYLETSHSENTLKTAYLEKEAEPDIPIIQINDLCDQYVSDSSHSLKNLNYRAMFPYKPVKKYLEVQDKIKIENLNRNHTFMKNKAHIQSQISQSQNKPKNKSKKITFSPSPLKHNSNKYFGMLQKNKQLKNTQFKLKKGKKMKKADRFLRVQSNYIQLSEIKEVALDMCIELSLREKDIK